MATITPSEEQQEIIDEIENNSIIGDCVAGSGKTTTVLFLAKTYPTKKILQITYNAQLKIEVREKVEKANIKNLEIHTFHSLAVKYYDSQGREDSVMRKIVEKDYKPHRSIPLFDIVVIDESQDMKENYYFLIKKFIKDLNNDIKLLVLGDKYQGVYKFMGADIRFLTLAHKIWSDYEFTHKQLTTTYRVTNEIAQFVNEVMLGHNRLKATKHGKPVTYIRQSIFKVHFLIANFLLKQIQENNIKPEDIFILAPSINGSKTPIRNLENELVKHNIPCFYPTSDDKKLDEDIIQGKVIFSTFHQAKGRERKLVIVYNFDSSYFTFYGKEYNPNVCPETLYVACTRAKEQLIVIEDKSKETKMLPFLKKNHEQMMDLPYIDFIGDTSTFFTTEIKQSIEKHNTSPTELVKYLKDYHLEALSGFIEQLFTVEKDPYYDVFISSKVQFGSDHFEEVSDINGLTIPTIYENRLNGESVVEKVVKDKYSYLSNTKQHFFLQNGYKKINEDCKTVEDFLYLTTMYVSFNEELYHKLQQFKHYKWLNEKQVEQCIKPLYEYLPQGTIFEQDIQYDCNIFGEYGSVFIRGRLDAITSDIVWELKCVESLTIEHYLQLIVYGFMWKREYEELNGIKKFKILNMRTGEAHILDINSYLNVEVMKILLENKYGKKPDLTDDEFINNCIKKKGAKVGTVSETCLFADE